MQWLAKAHAKGATATSRQVGGWSGRETVVFHCCCSFDRELGQSSQSEACQVLRTPRPVQRTHDIQIYFHNTKTIFPFILLTLYWCCRNNNVGSNAVCLNMKQWSHIDFLIISTVFFPATYSWEKGWLSDKHFINSINFLGLHVPVCMNVCM